MEDLSDDKLIWQHIRDLSTDGCVRVVDFSKRVPGFSELITQDQVTLLKASCLEILVSSKGKDLDYCLSYDLSKLVTCHACRFALGWLAVSTGLYHYYCGWSYLC